MDDLQQFESYLSEFKHLNPTAVELIKRKLFRLAEDHSGDPDFFTLTLRLTEETLSLYLKSPVKVSEQHILNDFYSLLNKETAKLIEAGTLAPLPEKNSNMALVPAYSFSSLDWINLQSHAKVPATLENAFEAAQHRHREISSVLETLFKLLLILDRDKAFDWKQQFIGNGDLDPDLVRDFLRAWHHDVDRKLPEPLIRQVLEWCDDNDSQRCWPTIIEEADSLLRQLALHEWHQSGSHTIKHASKLKKLHPYHDSDRLLHWLRGSITMMGESVEFFSEQSEALQKNNQPEDAWRRDALFAELMWLARIMPIIMVQADLILRKVDGPYEFAMAVFGFTTDYKERWRHCLVEKSRTAVRKLFLLGVLT